MERDLFKPTVGINKGTVLNMDRWSWYLILPNQVIIGANVDYETLKVFLKRNLQFEDGDLCAESISSNLRDV